MKKTLIAAVAAAALFASCQKAAIEGPDAGEEYVEVTCGVTTDDAATRAFFDNTAVPETWESEIRSVTLYGFSTGGSRRLRHNWTQDEIAAGRVTLRLLKTTYDFYVVVNYDYPDASGRGRDHLRSKHESALDSYNGTMAQVAGACKRPEGFVMVGQHLGVNPQQTTSFLCNLRRTVAKVALRTNVVYPLSASYPNGRLRIDNCRLSGFSMNSPLFNVSEEIRAGYYFNQAPAATGYDRFENLFYVYPNTAKSADKYVAATLTGVFDRDGNFATTGDQQAVTYTVKINPSGDGSLLQNGYYRIESNIKQLP